MSRFGHSRAAQTPDICRDPEWIAHWSKAGIYDAVCHTHAIEQAILRDLKKQIRKRDSKNVSALVAQLISMGHSLKAIDNYVQDGGFGPVAAYLKPNL